MPPVSVSFRQSCPALYGMRSTDNASRQVRFEQRIFPLIFILTFRQIVCPQLLLLMRIYFVNTVWTLQLFFKITAIKFYWSDLKELIFDYTI